MNHGEHGFFAGDAVFGIEAVNAEKLAGPDAFASFDVIFPAACAGNLLGMQEERFLLTQRLFGEAPLGDIAREQADRTRLRRAAADRRNARLKPAPASGKIHGEFDVLAIASLNDPTEQLREGMKDFFAEDFKSMATEEFGAAFAGESS